MSLQSSLIVGGVATVLIGGLLWHDHWISKKYQAEKQRTEQLGKQLTAEREEKEKANAASERYQGRIRQLETDAVTEPIGPVFVCRKSSMRAATTQPGPNATTIPHDQEAAERDSDTATIDIGPALDTYGTQCEANMIKVEELQSYLRSLLPPR